MNPQRLDSLLSLDRLSTSDPLVAFEFAYPLPAWAWALILPACIAFALLTYTKLVGKRLPRMALGITRALLVVLLALLLSGPQLARQTERVEKDWVLFLIDRSLSLAVADAPSPEGPVTREAQLQSVVSGFSPVVSELRLTRNVAASGFGASTFDLTAAFTATPPTLPAMGSRATRLGEAIDDTLAAYSGRPIAGLVVISDGRTSESLLSPQRIAALNARSIPVFTVPLGSELAVPDLSIARVDATSTAFLEDVVPIGVTVALNGPNGVITDGTGLPPSGTIELFDEDTGRVLSSRPLAEPDPAATNTTPGTFRFTLSTKAEAAGVARWAVRLRPETPDLAPTNNSASFRIDFADRPIRILYLDGYPRWEYRYLKNTLMREASIRSSVLILSSDRRFLREGTDPIDGAPRTLPDWSAFDAVILGDLRPELFSDAQISQLRSMVAERGAGLVWLGGPSAVPNAWKASPLADLLPFTPGVIGASGVEPGKPWLDPVLIRPAPAARRFGVLQLGDSAESPWPGWLSDGSLNWSFLRYAQRFDISSLKPTTEVLAEAVTKGRSGDSAASPLVMTMRYGAGRIVYVGTDEVWRLRFGRGETLPERFWIPLLRLAARESLGRSGKSAVLELSPTTGVAGRPVQITLRLIDQSLLDAAPESLRIRVSRESDAHQVSQPPVELTLLRQAVRSADPFESAASVGNYSGTFTPSDQGRFAIDSTEPLLSAAGLSASLEVVLPDDELRIPQTDHPLLAQLSAQTSGAVIAPANIGTLATMLPNREVRILGVPDVETLWDKPLALILFILLLGVEWVGRRVIRLS